MIIKIIKCSNQDWWYRNHIGEYFNVTKGISVYVLKENEIEKLINNSQYDNDKNANSILIEDAIISNIKKQYNIQPTIFINI